MGVSEGTRCCVGELRGCDLPSLVGILERSPGDHPPFGTWMDGAPGVPGCLTHTLRSYLCWREGPGSGRKPAYREVEDTGPFLARRLVGQLEAGQVNAGQPRASSP